MCSCQFWEISKNTFFKEHLWATASVISHRKNIQTLMIKIHKTEKELAPPIMDSMLNRRSVICHSFSQIEK